MTNHPNRASVYRVQHQDGRFSHVRGKDAALKAAQQEAGAPADTTEDVLSSEWGVTITKVSAAVARSVGL
jgi:hypothetical protein